MRPDFIMSTWLPKELQTLNLVSRLKLYEAQLPVLLKFLCKVGWSKSFRGGSERRQPRVPRCFGGGANRQAESSSTSRRQGKRGRKVPSPLLAAVRPPLLPVARFHMAQHLHGQSDLTDGERLRFSPSNSSSSSSSLFLLAAPADDGSLCRARR